MERREGTPAPELIVTAQDASFERAARGLATRLGGVMRTGDVAPGAAPPLELRIGAGGLELRTDAGTVVRAAEELLVRPRAGRDLLARAVGPVGAGTVVDATAGLGGDSFHLAAAGYRVIMVERVPLVAALLEGTLERARAGALGDAARAAAAELRLVTGDARELLARLRASGELPAVVLLDPMYPRRGKAALPGKGMALFRDLVGEDADAAGLLEAALHAARRRVVVKRPLKAPPLGGVRPSGSLRGSTTRYDLYAPTPPPAAALSAPSPSERKLG